MKHLKILAGFAIMIACVYIVIKNDVSTGQVQSPEAFWVIFYLFYKLHAPTC